MANFSTPHHDVADRINICEERDVAYWTETLGVSEEELRRTVAEVGDEVEAVCERHPFY